MGNSQGKPVVFTDEGMIALVMIVFLVLRHGIPNLEIHHHPAA